MDDAREIAAKLTEAQRRAVIDLDSAHDSVKFRLAYWGGTSDQRPPLLGYDVVGQRRKRRIWRYLPLGLQIRAILQEQSK